MPSSTDSNDTLALCRIPCAHGSVCPTPGSGRLTLPRLLLGSTASPLGHTMLNAGTDCTLIREHVLALATSRG